MPAGACAAARAQVYSVVMDLAIMASAQALAVGDALGALNSVALRTDAPAMALRGIALAQLGEYQRARVLLRRAARGFGEHEALARSRCIVAEAEVALAERDIGGGPDALAAALATLDAKADYANARQAELIMVRRCLLRGALVEAEQALARLDLRRAPPSLSAVAELTGAELALRSLHMAQAKAALVRARAAARRSRVPALQAEVMQLWGVLKRPAARRLFPDGEQVLCLDEVASLLASGAFVVDACRHGLAHNAHWLSLARRPVLFALARMLAQAWPGGVSRERLIAHAFRTRRPDESHRARLRVEISRLRKLAATMVSIVATQQGFALRLCDGGDVALLAPPCDDGQTALLALLSDGAAWSTSALALALDTSQRTVQRELVQLQAAGRVRTIGRARRQRWLSPPLGGFTTILLLPSVAPKD